MDITERVTMMVPETEEGQNSIAFIIKEELLRIEEDDEDWSYFYQGASLISLIV